MNNRRVVITGMGIYSCLGKLIGSEPCTLKQRTRFMTRLRVRNPA